MYNAMLRASPSLHIQLCIKYNVYTVVPPFTVPPFTVCSHLPGLVPFPQMVTLLTTQPNPAPIYRAPPFTVVFPILPRSPVNGGTAVVHYNN